MVRTWEEMCIRGIFELVKDLDDENYSQVQSHYYYNFELTDSAHFVFGLHQEDERQFGIQCTWIRFRHYALYGAADLYPETGGSGMGPGAQFPHGD